MKAYCGQITESDSRSNIIFWQIRSPCHAGSYPKIEMITPTPSKEPKLGSSSVPGQPRFVQKEQETENTDLYFTKRISDPGSHQDVRWWKSAKCWWRRFVVGGIGILSWRQCRLLIIFTLWLTSILGSGLDVDWRYAGKNASILNCGNWVLKD